MDPNTQITKYTVARNLFGVTIVKYACPGCKVKLKDPMAKAGQSGTCPACKIDFLIPGEKELSQQREAEAENKKREEAKAGEKRVIAEKKKQEASKSERRHKESEKGKAASEIPPVTLASPAELNFDPLFDLPPSAHLTGDQVVAVRSPPPDNRPPKSPLRRNSHPEHDNQQWWKPSIQLRDIRQSRYPALTAYRNLMVVVWWIFSLLLLFAIFLTPFYLGALLSQDYRSETESINAQVDALSNLPPQITNSLEGAATGRGMSNSDRESLRDALYSFDYDQEEFLSDFRTRALTSSEVSTFATSFSLYREKKLRELRDSEPNIFPVIVIVIIATIAAWAFLLITGVLYTIFLLVPPECIQLAIDVESGIRANRTLSPPT